jgi:hypothetical protein
MKRVFGLAFLLLLLALVAAAICPMSMNCAIHDGWVANYTGTRMVDGVLVGVYHCPYGPGGHNFIVRCN